MNTESFLPFLFELLAKSAVILLVAALIVRGWRRATAAQRHFVWFAAMATLLVLPLTRLGAPRWTVPLEPTMRVRVPMTALSRAPVVETGASVDPISAPRRAPWKLPGWRSVLIGIWLSGGALLLGYRLLGSWRLRRLEKGSARLEDARVLAMAGEILRDSNVERAVQMRISETCRVPLTWGARRPVLMLPREALIWSEPRLRAALRHEAGHISRQDYLVRGIAQAACALYWPNPLVWWAARSLRVAQEQATDDLVLRAGTPAVEYAAQLFDAARTVATRGFFAPHAVAMASPSTLEDRVLAIVDERRDRRPLSRFAALAGLSMIALTLAISTAAQLQAADRGPAPAAETPGAATAKPAERQVEIQAKFVEMSTKTEFPVFSLGELGGAVPFDKIGGVFSDPQFQVLIRALNQRKGVDLLAAPRITTKSKQPAVIEIVRDFRSPSEWEKDPKGAWKPKEFESKKVGVTLEVRPEIKPDGSIELRVKPSVVEFRGFVDLDTGKSGDATWELDAGSMPDLTTLRPVGKRLKPIFSERTIETTVVLKNGDTAALSGMKEIAEVEETSTDGTTTTITRRPVDEPSPKNAPNTVTIRRKLLVFVSARIVDPKKEEPTAMPPGSAAERASKIFIPKIEFRAAGLRECVALLQQKGRDHSPDGQGVNLGLILSAGDEPKITLSLTNISLLEAVKNVAQLSGTAFATQPDALVLGTAEAAIPVPASAALEKAVAR